MLIYSVSAASVVMQTLGYNETALKTMYILQIILHL